MKHYKYPATQAYSRRLTFRRRPSTRVTPPVDILKKGVKNKLHRKKKLEQLGGWEGMPPDMGVCWMCWIELTNEDLNDWRDKYAKIEYDDKVKTCPLCGYDQWRGAIWYPQKYLMDTEENPSYRNPRDARNK